MATIHLDITLTTDGGAQSAFMAIDQKGVPIDNGAGVDDVDAGEHGYTVFLTGPEGCSASFEIKQGASSLKKRTCSVPAGKTHEVDPGTFHTV
jgi:hypothetical protein